MILEVSEPVMFSYPEKRECTYCIPKGIGFSLNKTYSILGISGSGKSTILTLLAALRRFNKGCIRYTFTDTNVVSVTSENWKDTVHPGLWGNIGFSFQKPELIRALTIRMNLEIAVGRDNAENMALDLFGRKYWNDIKNSRIWEISGGQIQRIGLIRAFGRDQNLVFMDEPTNNLDKSNREDVIRFIRKYRGNKAIVMVSHDEKFLDMLNIDQKFGIHEESGKKGYGRILRPMNDKKLHKEDK